MKINDLCQILHQARLNASPVPQLSRDVRMSRSEAYQVQEAGIALRIQAGEKLVGLKMGLTSEGKRRQMNLDCPLFGELTDKMQVESGGVFHLKGSIHPKIEPEIAFTFAETLKGEVTREQVLKACSGVCACLEILDSRYEQFKYFSMEDVIADNSSSSHFISGPMVKDFTQLDLINLSMNMSINGAVVQSGVSSAISGDPVQSVIELCNLLFERGRSLPAGSIVLAGAATPAVTLEPNMKVELDVEGLPRVHVNIEE